MNRFFDFSKACSYHLLRRSELASIPSLFTVAWFFFPHSCFTTPKKLYTLPKFTLLILLGSSIPSMPFAFCPI
ncbi:Uncharacterized protein APZ42_030015 [Daphnia magna]|uniref:Uncharacterized protein n=1 Tax=Daphnia magna TaxID=35525 RepID=A0A164P4M5_9CRUS|nr:Uncharacterized protein APZ42_030015 [Daphnia magna]